MRAENWQWVDTGPGAAAFNMALDEALLETVAARARPLLRFYAWTERAATFGYSQRYGEVEPLTPLRPLIRRPTGGGLVPHDADWTYSLVFPPDHWWYASRARESYERVHAWLRDAFGRLGVMTALAPAARQEAPGTCFVGAEQHDLLWRGQKIAGAAQRRNRLGLLIQGSVQPPPLSLARTDWQGALCALATEQWGVGWVAIGREALPLDRARSLADARYSRSAFNQKR